ncbi:MAG: AAA family ATPase, partial [Rhodoferax sp.]|nr:AAA family ATPase [Rhodoferax sp.]
SGVGVPVVAVTLPQAAEPDLPSPAPVAVAAPDDEGERRHATVMFSDLTGYTALNEAFDPEEVEGIMARIKREAVAVIERHGGRVNQFVGDEVMALFGVPVARRDDPRRAVAAALELHAVVDGIAAGLAQRLGRLLSMHTGIQTGLVIARRSDSRSGDYTLTGDTVNTAARLRALAQPGEVVVSSQTWQQVSDYFEATARQPIEVKGKERPLIPYRVLGERTVPRVGSRPLVGRADEVQQFETLMEASQNRGRGRVVFVRGDPGLGKSRLVAEFLHSALERGMVCHSVSILDFGARTGHDAIRALAQSLLGLPADADEGSRADAIRERSVGEGAAWSRYLYDLLDVAAPAEVGSLLSATELGVRQKGTQEALCQLLVVAPGAPAQFVLVEDIHWADPWTLQQLGAVAALALKHPLLFMMSTRFGGDPTVGDWRAALHGLPITSIDLGPLGLDDALRLAAGAASISDALLRSCVERAEGNPLFLEQLLLSAGDEGAGNLPGSIQALIQARMDRLPPADKAALQAASVWGPRVPLAVVRHLLGDLAYDSHMLVEQFLLRPEGDELVFSHALIRDGAYGSLLHARRRQLHVLAAEWAEPRDDALAAEHYERAEDARASTAYLRAAKVLAGRFEYAQALTLLGRGLKLSDAPAQCFPLRLARARLLLEVGQPTEAIIASDSALAVAQSEGDQALGLIAKASAMRILDRIEDGLQLLARAQPLAEGAGLTLDLSRLHHLRGNLLFATGRDVECQQEHARALDLARAAGSPEATVAAMGGLGDAVYAQGRVLSAYSMFTRCVAMAHDQGFLRVEVSYLPMVAWCSVYMMDMEAAMDNNRHALGLAVRTGNQRTQMMALAQAAMFDGWIRGNWRAAIANAEQAIQMAVAIGSKRFQAMALYIHALLGIRAGDLASARVRLDAAFAAAGEGAMGFLGPQLYATLARIEPDPALRQRALAAGSAILQRGAVSHNHLVYYDAAISVSLQLSDWAAVDANCQKLEDYASAEPFAWSQFLVQSGRALNRAGQGEAGPELVQQLQRLRSQCESSTSTLHLPEINAALARLGYG